MDLSSTQLISYRDIMVEDIDLFEDAWGMRSEFPDVFSMLGQVKAAPEPGLTKKLIGKIRNQD